jgi:urate oxidase
VDAKQVPEAAMKGIVKAAEGATIKQLAKIEIRCETKDGKIVKLDKAKLNFEAELTKGDQTGEVTVDDQGNIVEAVKWEKKQEEKK